MDKCVTDSKNEEYAEKMAASAEFGRKQDEKFPVRHGNHRLA